MLKETPSGPRPLATGRRTARFCLQLTVKLLSKLLGQDQASDGIVIQKGLLFSVTDFIKRRLADPSMIKHCLEALATLSDVESSDTTISRLGPMAVIIELLRKHSDNQAVLEDVITALALMAKRTRHLHALSQSQGITILVDLLKRCIGRPSLVVTICRFLSNSPSGRTSAGRSCTMAAWSPPWLPSIIRWT